MRVAAENCQLLGPRLRDQQPVERIAMDGRKSSDTEGVMELHRKDLEAVLLELFGDEYLGLVGESHAAQTGLDRDLPGARRAEVDLVRSVGDHPARPARQLGAVGDPPEKGMGIEKDPHSNRFCSSFGSGASKFDATVMRPRAVPGTLRTT